MFYESDLGWELEKTKNCGRGFALMEKNIAYHLLCNLNGHFNGLIFVIKFFYVSYLVGDGNGDETKGTSPLPLGKVT